VIAWGYEETRGVRDLSQDLVGRVRKGEVVTAEAVQGELSPSQAALRLVDCFMARDWTGLETIYHPEALITSVAGGMVPLTGPGMVAAIRAAANGLFEFEVMYLSDLDECTCLVSGRIRHSVAGGGFADHQSHWLCVFKDGLLWRCGVYTSARKALAAFADHGHRLGIEAAQRETADL
jgi:hypothetical protein